MRILNRGKNFKKFYTLYQFVESVSSSNVLFLSVCYHSLVGSVSSYFVLLFVLYHIYNPLSWKSLKNKYLHKWEFSSKFCENIQRQDNLSFVFIANVMQWSRDNTVFFQNMARALIIFKWHHTRR